MANISKLASAHSSADKAGISTHYSIFLRAVEYLLAEAMQVQDNRLWYPTPKIIDLSQCVLCYNRFHTRFSHTKTTKLDRFRSVATISQINRETRAMVHKVFVRLPSFGEDGPYNNIDDWIRPDIDLWVPGFFSQTQTHSDLLFTEALFAILASPKPQEKLLLKSMEHVLMPGAPNFYIRHTRAMKALAGSMPNLKAVHWDMGEFVNPGANHVYHPGIKRVDLEMFPGLGRWEAANGLNLDGLWAPFRKRGVVLLARFQESPEPMGRLYPTKKGLQFEWSDVMLNCDCCEYKKASKERVRRHQFEISKPGVGPMISNTIDVLVLED